MGNENYALRLIVSDSATRTARLLGEITQRHKTVSCTLSLNQVPVIVVRFEVLEQVVIMPCRITVFFRQSREASVPRLITVHRSEQISQQAHQYVKSYILFPSGLLGLICLIGGVGGLGYQLIVTDKYTWGTFYQSSGLIVLGVALGVAQSRYHQYLLRRFPEVLAARMRHASARQRAKTKKESQPVTIDHPGRRFIPLAYVAGMTILVGSAVAAFMYGHVSVVPALLMPWAGFYWARLFSWRSVVK